ncbi:uncharacterized protein N7459_009662 [Penicillium hispanicum]|uniref:uncharacterized protein n=1 Tax=Penicillium hispanicum TaxID=1080232 RepID=UPI00253FFBD7|nr:uncharacterized protein N7459_009662 [Penicillium hispanicum]KAJ5570232.1 hypothetical protein N7459_009662 [Penicillium hispanicum]
MPSQQLQFINETSRLTGATGSPQSQRKIARSHAARSVHAKVRRLRTIQYQAQKNHEQEIRLQQPRSGSPTPRAAFNVGLVTLLSAGRKDPFGSAARPVKPLENRLLDHYVTAIIPLMRCNELAMSFSQRMNSVWVPFALTESRLLDIMFLGACRHLAASYQEPHQHQFFTRLACQYKLKSLQALRDTISAEMPSLSDSTVAMAIMLAYDELFVRDTIMLERHVSGAVKMVQTKGGIQTLGLDGLLEHLLSNLLAKVRGHVGRQIETK